MSEKFLVKKKSLYDEMNENIDQNYLKIYKKFNKDLKSARFSERILKRMPSEIKNQYMLLEKSSKELSSREFALCLSKHFRFIFTLLNILIEVHTDECKKCRALVKKLSKKHVT